MSSTTSMKGQITVVELTEIEAECLRKCFVEDTFCSNLFDKSRKDLCHSVFSQLKTLTDDILARIETKKNSLIKVSKGKGDEGLNILLKFYGENSDSEINYDDVRTYCCC